MVVKWNGCFAFGWDMLPTAKPALTSNRKLPCTKLTTSPCLLQLLRSPLKSRHRRQGPTRRLWRRCLGRWPMWEDYLGGVRPFISALPWLVFLHCHVRDRFLWPKSKWGEVFSTPLPCWFSVGIYWTIKDIGKKGYPIVCECLWYSFIFPCWCQTFGLSDSVFGMASDKERVFFGFPQLCGVDDMEKLEATGGSLGGRRLELHPAGRAEALGPHWPILFPKKNPGRTKRRGTRQVSAGCFW